MVYILLHHLTSAGSDLYTSRYHLTDPLAVLRTIVVSLSDVPLRGDLNTMYKIIEYKGESQLSFFSCTLFTTVSDTSAFSGCLQIGTVKILTVQKVLKKPKKYTDGSDLWSLFRTTLFYVFISNFRKRLRTCCKCCK